MNMTNEQIALRLKWAAALESGRYAQAYYKLRERTNAILEKVPTYAYCCLGVAIEEFGDHTWDQGGRNLNLSVNACEALAIDNPHEDLNCDDLATLNDDDRLTFTKIAAVIRKNTPKPTEEKG